MLPQSLVVVQSTISSSSDLQLGHDYACAPLHRRVQRCVTACQQCTSRSKPVAVRRC